MSRAPVPAGPALRVDLARSVPGWAVRVLPAAVVLLVALASGGGSVVWFVAVAVAGLIALRPGWPTAGGVVALVGTWVLAHDDLLAAGPGGALRLAALVLGAHLVVRLGGVAAHAAWSARVEVAVLRRTLLPVVLVQTGVLVLLVVVGVLRSGVGIPGVGWLRGVAVVAVVTLVLLLVPRQWLGGGRR